MLIPNLCFEDWEYLAEGNANVVLRFIGSNQSLVRTVIRLGKEMPGSLSVEERHAYFEETILTHLSPQLAEYVLPNSLFDVDVLFLAGINEHLERISPSRPIKFRNTLVNVNEQHGLLLPFLSSSPSQRLLEFKPKWLEQSPHAPLDAWHCRTCALRQMRSGGKSPGGFCPLNLASSSPSRVERAIRALNAEKLWMLPESLVKIISSVLLKSNIPLSLKQAQIAAAHDLALSMTLRDCSMYVIVDLTSRPAVDQVWLADFDKKSMEANAMRWSQLEHDLSAGNWYYASTLDGRLIPRDMRLEPGISQQVDTAIRISGQRNCCIK